MKTLKIEQYGIENLELTEVEDPHAREGEVRVKVRAASINPADWKMLDTPGGGKYFGTRLPSGFAMDFGGVVDEVGEGVSNFAVGDHVYGSRPRSAAAEYVVVRADGKVHHTPEGLSDEIAATLWTGGSTAYAGISELRLTPDDVVLVNGAGGGVGTFATQLAARTGATVLGTASAQNADYLRELGAIPIDYRGDLAEQVRAAAPRGVTAVADFNGHGFVWKAVEELGVEPGRITTVTGDGPVPAEVHQTGGWHAPAEAVEEVADLLARGEIHIPIQRVYPLAGFADAIAEQRAGHVRGKILLSLE